MANASSKRIAAQNEASVRNLNIGMLVAMAFSIALRLLFRRHSLPPSVGLWSIFILTSIPHVLIYRYLVKIGTVKRDPSGALISSGEDLAQPGITEWCFDIIYITWACQVGSSAFGEWFWWLYLSIPIYAGYKAWSTFFKGSPASPSGDDSTSSTEPAVSKRQEKLRKRGERGDSRVKVSTGKK